MPAEIGKLTGLQALHLSNNKLTSLPPEIGKLTKLQELSLYNNQLTSLPPEIGQLRQLQGLSLYNNQLTSLPLEIGQLAQLQHLFLSNNKLTYLPPEIGQLTRLRWLTIDLNKQLQSLPMSLEALIHLIPIDIKGTSISQVQVENLCAVWQKVRDLAAWFEFWLKTAGLKTDLETNLKNVLSFNEEERGLLNEWLLRLAKTKDYQSCQQRLATIVCKMLQSLKKLPEFQKLFFTQVENDNSSCEDRAAMSLNLLYTAWKVHTLPEGGSIQEKFALIQRAARAEALRAYLADCIDRRQKSTNAIEQESVEIYLYYETALRKKLDLLTAIDQMAYGQIGKRSWITETLAIEYVEKNAMTFFYSHPSLIKLALEQPQVKPEVEKARIEAAKRLREAPKQDGYSVAYLDWQTKQNEVKQDLEEKIHAICAAWAKEQLGFT